MFGLLAAIVFGGVVSHVIASKHRTLEAARQLNLTPEMIASAKKWALRRGLPARWVVTTILVESEGKPHAVGDEGGRSVGLMQVNTVAHADEMRAAGVTRTAMFGVDKNIEWGTKVLKDVYDQVVAAGAKHSGAPIDVVTRLAYKGPTTVVGALKRGQNPVTISWAPEAVMRWRKALTKVAPLV